MVVVAVASQVLILGIDKYFDDLKFLIHEGGLCLDYAMRSALLCPS